MIRFQCPSCAETNELGDETAGATCRCSNCGLKFNAPAATPPATPTPRAPAPVRRRHRRSQTGYILMLSLLVQVLLGGVLWCFEPLRKSTMSVDKEKARQQDSAAKKSAEERAKREQDERMGRKLSREDSQKLKKEEERKRERKICDKIEDMRKMKREIAESKGRKLAELAKRPFDSFLTERLLQLAQKLRNAGHLADLSHNTQLSRQTSELSGNLLQKTEELVRQPGKDREVLREMGLKIRENAGVLHGSPQYRQNSDRNLVERTDDLVAMSEAFLKVFDLSPEINGKDEAAIPDPSSGQDLSKLNVEELHEASKKLEKAISDDYASIRAADLAMLQNQTYDEAKSNISDLGSAANPPEALSKERMGTLGEVNEYRKQLDQVVDSINAMWANASNMVNESKAGLEKTSEGKLQTAMAMNKAAIAPKGHLIDLSTAMRRHAGASMGGGISVAGGGGGGGDSAPGAGHVGEASDLRSEIRNLGDSTTLDTETITAEALPGRMFTKNSKRSGWMFIDTWYVIGPWKAEFPGGNIDYETTHQPDARVDLDATYRDGKPWEKGPNEGKPRELRWRFHQSPSIRITPPDEQSNSTYYAYTEVYFDEDTDMFITAGADDAIKLWINDVLVCQDGAGVSPWSMDKAFRKVFFKKGFNRLLARVTDGPGRCHWSVLLCPIDSSK